MRIGLILATAATALAVATAAPAATFYVTTGQAAGVFSIDAGGSRTWTIPAQGSTTEFGGGIFMMKRGAGISAGITLALYEDTGNLLASVSSSVGQDYAQISFLMAVPFGINPLDTYMVRLNVGDGTPLGGDDQYFIKGITDTLTLDTSAPEDIVLEPVPTPEPASALLLAAGVLGLGIARRRALRRAPASA